MKHSKNSRGFSLIEVLIALVILSVSLLGLAGLMVTTTKNNSFGSHMTEAATFAQDKLEELRVTPQVLIINSSDVVQNPITGFPYNRTWTISSLPNPAPPPTDLQKGITITVSWNGGSNSIRLSSLISD